MAGKKVSITAVIGVNSSALMRGLKGAAMKMKAWAKATMARMAAIAKQGVILAAAAFGVFAYKSLKEFASFEQGMNEVFTLLPGLSKKSMAAMEANVLNLAKTMGILPETVVPALYQALSAGIPKENVFSFLEIASRAAIGGAVSLETAVNGLTGVINAYGKENISATKVSDIMFLAVRLGRTTFDEMAKSLGDATPLAAALGISFGELAAALAASTSITGNTAKSLTGLKGLMAELGKSGQIAARNFEAIAGQSFPAFIKSGGTMQQALKMMKARADATGGSIMDMFGGLEAGQMALQLTEGGARAFAAAVGEMGNEAGVSSAAFTGMNRGMSRNMAKLSAGFKVVMIQFGKAMAPVLELAMPLLQRVLKKMEGIDWAKIINGFARVWFIGLKPTFDAVYKAIVGLPWHLLVDYLLPIAGLVIRTIQKIGKIIVGLSPMIVPLIMTLAGYFTLLYGRFFLMIHFLEKVAPQIGAVFKEIFSIVSAVMGFIINPSAEKFKWLVQYIKDRFSGLGGSVKGLFARMFGVMKETLGKIGGVIKTAFGMFVDSMWQSILKFLKKWPNVWKAVEGLVRMFKTMKHEITGEIMALKDAFSGLFSGVGSGGKVMEWLADTGKWLSKALGELIELTLKYYTALIKVYGIIVKVIARLLTSLAPALKEIIPVALKIAAAAVYFLMEGVKVLFWVFKQWLKYTIWLLTQLKYLEPVLMLLVTIISGFVMAVVEGIKAIWSILNWLYFGAKEVLAKLAEGFVSAFYGIKKVVTTVLDFIIGLFKKLKDFVFEILFGGTITKDFKAAFEFIEKLVMRVLKAIFTIFKQFNEIVEAVLLGVADVFRTIFKGIVKVVQSVGEVVESIFVGIASVVETMGNAVKKVFDSMGRFVKTLLKAFTNMGEVIRGIFDKVLEIGGKALKLAGKAAGFVGGAISSVGGALGIGGKKPKRVSPQVGSGSLRTSLKPIVTKLSSIDGHLRSIDHSLKGRYTNQ